MKLEELGNRICILGPSNSGKSTLSHAIGKKLGYNIIHLDQLYHRPNTNWKPRPFDEFIELHDTAILDECWIIEGNYSGCLTQRLNRATGVIFLAPPVFGNVYRYVRRTLFEPSRHGNLEGAKNRLNWRMMRYIILEQPKQLIRNEQYLKERGDKCLKIRSLKEVNEYYMKWQVSRL